MRPIWKILIVAGIVLALALGALVIPHYRAKGAVEAYRRTLKGRGEKISVAELTPSVSAEEAKNGRELVAASGFAGTLTDSPPVMRWTSPGHALVCWQETNSVTDKSTNCWPEFIAVMKTSPEMTDRITAALGGKALAFNLDYSPGFNTLLPHLSQLKRASLWLSGAVSTDLHGGDSNGAWRALTAEAELNREYKSEPFIISQLVRIGMAQIGIGTTWEALQYRGWSEEQLAELQTDWESFDLMDELETALSMERVMQGGEFEQMRRSFSEYSAANSLYNNSSFDSIGQVLINPKEGIQDYLGRPMHFCMWKWWGSYKEELYAMQVTQSALEAIRSARRDAAFIPALNAYYETVTNQLQKAHPGWEKQFVFANGLTDTIGRFLLRSADTETARRMLVAAIALERFRLRHGHYPAALEDMTPGILPKVPVDFMDGRPLRYRHRNDGTFLLYSVGEDEKDGGGDGSPPRTDVRNNKVWYKMRDIVWPAPATADEVTKYEAEMLQKLKNKPPGKLVPQMTIPEPAGTNSKTN
jgi:hypothetical protein